MAVSPVSSEVKPPISSLPQNSANTALPMPPLPAATRLPIPQLLAVPPHLQAQKQAGPPPSADSKYRDKERSGDRDHYKDYHRHGSGSRDYHERYHYARDRNDGTDRKHGQPPIPPQRVPPTGNSDPNKPTYPADGQRFVPY